MEITIDGNKINNLNDFYNQIEPFLLPGKCPWGKNLDSLNEIVETFFNYTEDKSLNVKKIIWLNSERSKNMLGKEETIRWWKSKTGKSSGLSDERIDDEIKNLENGQSETLFEKIAEILQRNRSIGTLFISTKEDGAQFNRLEVSLLEWFAEKYNDAGLVSQVKSAIFKKREYNSAGFWIDLEIPDGLSPIDFSNLPEKEKTFPIGSPFIVSKDIENEAGAILWGEGGCIDKIEIFGSGDFFKEYIEDFELYDGIDSKEFGIAMDRKNAILKK